jgi:hypothetical protein
MTSFQKVLLRPVLCLMLGKATAREQQDSGLCICFSKYRSSSKTDQINNEDISDDGNHRKEYSIE